MRRRTIHLHYLEACDGSHFKSQQYQEAVGSMEEALKERKIRAAEALVAADLSFMQMADRWSTIGHERFIKLLGETFLSVAIANFQRVNESSVGTLQCHGQGLTGKCTAEFIPAQTA